MDIAKLKNQLRDQGYREQWEHEDCPGYEYAQHSHPVDTAYLVLQGSMTVWVDGIKRVLKAGDYIYAKKHEEHRVKIGPQGCRFLIGVRI